MTETVIKIQNLRKKYTLGAIGGKTFNEELERWWAKKRGKEDPTLKIGEDETRIGEEFWALDGINLEVKKGEALGIIGANGAGKSTLLKILSRVTAPTEGDIWMKGRLTSMLEVGTGFHPEMTGRENIYMNGAILGMSRKEVDDKIDSIIEFSECGQFIDTPVKRYSSGMYVKLAFSVASHLDSDIMIMDEVLAVGDMKFQKKCLGKMENEHETGNRTILYVSHNMATIRNLCTRCVFMDRGKILYDGEVEKAISFYLQTDNSQLLTDYDLSKAPRVHSDFGILIRLMSLKFEDCDIPVFSQGCPIKLRIETESMNAVNDVQFFMQVFREENGEPVGGIISQNTALSIGHNSNLYKVNFSGLVEGDYYLELVALKRLPGRPHITYDRTAVRAHFSFHNTADYHSLNWNRTVYGCISFPDMELIS